MRALCVMLLALLLSGGAAAQPGPLPAGVAVGSIVRGANGHDVVNFSDGSSVDLGIANVRSNTLFQTLGLSGTQAMVPGGAYGWVPASSPVASLTLLLPPSPQINDVVKFGSATTILSLTVLDSASVALPRPISGVALPGNALMSFGYTSGGWQMLTQPLPQVPFYGSSGVLTAVKCWIGQTTTTTGGVWSITFTGSGFTAAPTVNPQVISAGGVIATQYIAFMTAPTAAGVSGTIGVGTTLSLLGATLLAGPAGVVVSVLACGP